MSDPGRLFGARNVTALFGDAPIAPTPWGRAGGLRKREDYEKDKVRAVLMHPDRHELVEVDPRNLKATQPMVTRAGVQHYLENPDVLYDNVHNAGNHRPIIYDREGTKLILSGHHRGAAALLRGEQFKAVLVEGSFGSAR